MSIYIFDNSSLSVILNNYYEEIFPTFWEKFDSLIVSGQVISIKEVKRELEAKSFSIQLDKRSIEHKKIFVDLTVNDFNIVNEIFKDEGFRQLVHRKNILNGTPCADPFLIAKAETTKGILVTQEKIAINSTNKLPNICKERGIQCINLKEFMELEDFNF